MAEYLSPGVYVQEIRQGLRPMMGVSTANLAIVGWFERGPTRPVFVSSMEQFNRIFGGIKRYKIDGTTYEYFVGPVSLLGWFQNGGVKAWVLRIKGTGAQEATGSLGEDKWTIKANSPGQWGNRLTVEVKHNTGNPDLWDVLVYYKETPEDEELLVEQWSEVQFVDDTKENYCPTALKDSNYIVIEKNNGGDLEDEEEVELTGGADGTRPKITAADLAPLDTVDEMLILIAPDWDTLADQKDVTTALITYAESRQQKDVFVIASVPKGQTPQDAKNYMVSTLNVNSSYYAIYYPWVKIVDPLTRDVKVFPPEGFVAGCYARTDRNRNVAKAPAGLTDGALYGIVGVERIVSKPERDLIYPVGINPIVSERQTGLAVWGARTGSKDPAWRYINVRRAFQYFEKSCFEATHWVVFESNTTATRLQVKLQLEAFLLSHFYEGYFAGNTPEESFFVICDETNNPPEVVNQGLLYVDVGLAIAKPAEFVVFRFAQKIEKK